MYANEDIWQSVDGCSNRANCSRNLHIRKRQIRVGRNGHPISLLGVKTEYGWLNVDTCALATTLCQMHSTQMSNLDPRL